MEQAEIFHRFAREFYIRVRIAGRKDTGNANDVAVAIDGHTTAILAARRGSGESALIPGACGFCPEKGVIGGRRISAADHFGNVVDGVSGHRTQIDNRVVLRESDTGKQDGDASSQEKSSRYKGQTHAHRLLHIEFFERET